MRTEWTAIKGSQWWLLNVPQWALGGVSKCTWGNTSPSITLYLKDILYTKLFHTENQTLCVSGWLSNSLSPTVPLLSCTCVGNFFVFRQYASIMQIYFNRPIIETWGYRLKWGKSTQSISNFSLQGIYLVILSCLSSLFSLSAFFSFIVSLGLYLSLLHKHKGPLSLFLSFTWIRTLTPHVCLCVCRSVSAL